MSDVDPTGPLGIIMEGMTTYISGDMFLTVFFLMMMGVLILMGAGLSLDVALFTILPVVIVVMAIYGQFVLMGILIFFFLSGVLTRTFFLR